MAVTLEDLKDELLITWGNDDMKLQRKLDTAIDIIERYTNQSLTPKTVTRIGNGSNLEFYGAPILNITGAKSVRYNNLGATIHANNGDTIEIELGAVNIKALDEAVIRIASTLYEDGIIDPVKLPSDVQLLVNQFRLDSFVS